MFFQQAVISCLLAYKQCGSLLVRKISVKKVAVLLHRRKTETLFYLSKINYLKTNWLQEAITEHGRVMPEKPVQNDLMKLCTISFFFLFSSFPPFCFWVHLGLNYARQWQRCPLTSVLQNQALLNFLNLDGIPSCCLWALPVLAACFQEESHCSFRIIRWSCVNHESSWKTWGEHSPGR